MTETTPKERAKACIDRLAAQFSFLEIVGEWQELREFVEAQDARSD